MGLFQKMAASFRRRLSLTDPEGWGAGGASYAGEVVTERSALALSAVWACVNLLSGTIASLPLQVYRTDASGQRSEAKDHPLYRVLHTSPNADQTALDFWEYMQASQELRGNAYARIVKSTNRVLALIPAPSDGVSVTRSSTGNLRYRWAQDGVAYDLDQSEVLHIRGFGGDPLGGLSTLAAARHVFGLSTAVDRAAGAMFANGMRPSVALTFEKFLTTEQRETAEKHLANKYIGAVNTGRPFINEGGSKIEPLGINPEDAQMLESRGFSVEEVCRFFGVPPFMVGHTSKSTSWGTGLEQQVLGFQKFALRRRLRRNEQALEKQLLSPQDRADGICIKFGLEGLLRGDTAARAAWYTAMLASGVMTINEVRALENLAPVEGGSVPRMQMQNVPISSPPSGSGAPPLSEGDSDDTDG